MSRRVPITHCLHGHEYTEANTYRTPKGTRECRTCRIEASRRSYAGERIPRPTLEERFWPKVSKTATCWLWLGAITSTGYGSFRIGGKAKTAHRVAYELLRGAVPAGLFLDHICHARNCVNPEHLRTVTGKQNSEHRAGHNKDNTSGVRGVFMDRRTGKWVASVGHNNKLYRVGAFGSLKEAEIAVIAKRNEFFTHDTSDGLFHTHPQGEQ